MDIERWEDHPHYPQAMEIARAYAYRSRSYLVWGIDKDDISAAATLGALQALSTYDESRGVKFSTHCVRRVTGAIQDWYRLCDHLSRSQRQKVRAWEARERERLERLELEPAGAGEPTADELALMWMVKRYKRPRRIDDLPPDSILLEDAEKMPEQALIHGEFCCVVLEVLAELPPLIQELYHLIYWEGLTSQQASKQLGQSRWWATDMLIEYRDQLAPQLIARGIEP